MCVSTSFFIMEIFKTVKVGGLTKSDLLQKLSNAGVEFNRYAKSLFEHPLFLPEQSMGELRLIRLSFSDLGLENPCSYHSLLRRAEVLGLKPCPLALGAFLRLEYLDQKEGPYLTIASEELGGTEDDPTGFYLRNTEQTLWLRGYRVSGEPDWPTENQFIFLK